MHASEPRNRAEEVFTENLGLDGGALLGRADDAAEVLGHVQHLAPRVNHLLRARGRGGLDRCAPPAWLCAGAGATGGVLSERLARPVLLHRLGVHDAVVAGHLLEHHAGARGLGTGQHAAQLHAQAVHHGLLASRTGGGGSPLERTQLAVHLQVGLEAEQVRRGVGGAAVRMSLHLRKGGFHPRERRLGVGGPVRAREPGVSAQVGEVAANLVAQLLHRELLARSCRFRAVTAVIIVGGD
mmetsp:Transcript_21590/g.69810  ORF Transcript_21590/g.69810 Transcript_21590/m.69810 type:complete len:240 (-) Transcript_21590:463-1182(-)